MDQFGGRQWKTVWLTHFLRTKYSLHSHYLWGILASSKNAHTHFQIPPNFKMKIHISVIIKPLALLIQIAFRKHSIKHASQYDTLNVNFTIKTKQMRIPLQF